MELKIPPAGMTLVLALGAVVAALLIVAAASYADPDADADAEPDPTGKLVVVPQVVQPGETVEAVAFHVFPADLPVRILSTAGTSPPMRHSCPGGRNHHGRHARRPWHPRWVDLHACTRGEGWVKIVDSGTGAVIKQVDRVP